jgi:hypothetical protein
VDIHCERIITSFPLASIRWCCFSQFEISVLQNEHTPIQILNSKFQTLIMNRRPSMVPPSDWARAMPWRAMPAYEACTLHAMAGIYSSVESERTADHHSPPLVNLTGDDVVLFGLSGAKSPPVVFKSHGFEACLAYFAFPPRTSMVDEWTQVSVVSPPHFIGIEIRRTIRPTGSGGEDAGGGDYTEAKGWFEGCCDLPADLMASLGLPASRGGGASAKDLNVRRLRADRGFEYVLVSASVGRFCYEENKRLGWMRHVHVYSPSPRPGDLMLDAEGNACGVRALMEWCPPFLEVAGASDADEPEKRFGPRRPILPISTT